MLTEGFYERLKIFDEYELVQWLSSEFSKECSDEMRATLQYLIEYYNESVFNLGKMGFYDVVENEKYDSKSDINIIEAKKNNELKMGLENLISDIKKGRDKNNLFKVSDLLGVNKLFKKEELSDTLYFDKLGEFIIENQDYILEIFKDCGDKKEDINFDSCTKFEQYLIENLNLLDNDKDKKLIVDFLVGFLVKYNRYCNLRAKIVHTARMVYMSTKQLSEISSDKNVQDLILMSLLYHDIGRFYQAVHYPNFNDKNVEEAEDKGKEKLKSHAEVGYYFPLQNLLIKDAFRTSGDIKTQFILHSLMTIPIKYHQKPNSELMYYDKNYDIKQLTEDDKDKLEEFLKKIYELAPEVELESKYETKKNVEGMKDLLADENILLEDNIKTMELFNIETAKHILKCINVIHKYKKNELELDYLKSEINVLVEYLRCYYVDEKNLISIIANPESLLEETFLESIFFQLSGKDVKKILNSIDDVKSINNVNLEEKVVNKINVLKIKIVKKDFATYLNDFYELKYLVENQKEFQNISNNEFFKTLVKVSGKSEADLKEILNIESFNEMTEKIFGADFTYTIELCHNLLCAATTITTDIDKIDILVQRANGSWEYTNGSCLPKVDYDKDKENLKKKITGYEFDIENGIGVNDAKKEEQYKKNCEKLKKLEDFFERTKNFSEIDKLREYIISDEVRDAFYKKSGDGKIARPNKITQLWWHIEQFVATNMRNYASMKILNDLNLMTVIYKQTVNAQFEEYKEALDPLVVEPLAFAEMFLLVALNTRIDKNGQLVEPYFKYDENNPVYYQVIPNESGYSIPKLFNSENMHTLRSWTIKHFQHVWKFRDNKPNPELPIELKGNLNTYSDDLTNNEIVGHSK